MNVGLARVDRRNMCSSIYPNQIINYITLFSKIRFSLTYLPKNLTSYVNAPKCKLPHISNVGMKYTREECGGTKLN